MTNSELLGIGSRVKHTQYGVGVITKVAPTNYQITFIQYGNVELPITAQLEVIEAVQPPKDTVTLRDVERLLSSLLEKWGGLQEVVELGERWKGGKIIIQPADEGLQAKEIPIDVFFHKIVMARDRLRVMEQQINAHTKLSDEEKVNLQQYITRIYGSLTTFNLLFKNKNHQFKGSSAD
ncbi:MAG TPA: hypothetical protein PK239_02595 [Chitinophagales bacterium]|nr:hypothetical protein [Chitinophagales bacterium]HRK26158.1 hypothetical protein [Chitinophagales bacterium]